MPGWDSVVEISSPLSFPYLWQDIRSRKSSSCRTQEQFTISRDFWRNSGFHLLERDRQGHLSITDDFLRAYLMRPEIRPVEESGPNEIALHEALLESPRSDPPASALDAVDDAHVRVNYRILLAFLVRLMNAA